MPEASVSWAQTDEKYDLATNLAELPFWLCYRVAASLDFNRLWACVVDQTSNNAYSLSSREYDRISKSKSPAASLLILWGNRGQTVFGLLRRLQSLSKIHGSKLDAPQLAFRRKYASLIWTIAEQITVKKTGCDGEWLMLVCHAKGFPYPCFQWRESDVDIKSATERILLIPRCLCQLQKKYTCKVQNEIKAGMEYSSFYRSNGKRYCSELVSNTVELTAYLIDVVEGHWCEQCEHRKSNRLGNDSANDSVVFASPGSITDKLVATDKVALVISNCNYESLQNLVTPHYDAELLTQSLQEMGFKTVTLGDLRLKELKFFINEYRKLLGTGVYAIFYFVGHGFEKNGENYLLAVDSPSTSYDLNSCISLKWAFSVFENTFAAMNLVLLDVCRKSVRTSVPSESTGVDTPSAKPCVMRNTICGFATSSGVSAYEVYGERNGVFMKHLLKHIADPVNVLEMLTRTFQDISNDRKVYDVQVPELRSNMTLPRSLLDSLISDGHTVSFNHHTLHWRFMHELPDPAHIRFEEHGLQVTVWYDFAGHFTNKVYIFSSVDQLPNSKNKHGEEAEYIARLRFPAEIGVSSEKMIVDGVEGLSLCWMLSNLQRTKGAVHCAVDLTTRNGSEVIATRDHVALGDVLVTRIYRSEHIEKAGFKSN